MGADVTFYCGVSEMVWNWHPTAPGPYTCISPVYGRSASKKRVNTVRIPTETEVIQDSGAFSDSWADRFSFEAALDRQIEHAERYDYVGKLTHRASYDLLIDEVWTDGNRYKRRWSENDAEAAVDETVAAAEYIAKHRSNVGLILSAQGVTADQYLRCAERVIPYLEAGDILGLGGWCITGKMPRVMMPTFRETIRIVVPYAARCGVKRIHIWGVIHAPALGELLWMCNQHEIALSTDSAGPSVRPAFGRWGYADWTDRNYKKPSTEILGLERARHVEAVRAWLSRLQSTRYCREPQVQPFRQLELAI